MDIFGNKLVNTIEMKRLFASSSNLADMLTIVKEWTLLRSKVKVTMDIHQNNLVNTMETEPFFASSLNLADMLTMVRE